MDVLLAVDGSECATRAATFLANHLELLGPEGRLKLLNVQPPMPPRVKTMVGATEVHALQHEDAEAILRPFEELLARHGVRVDKQWRIGHAAEEIAKLAEESRSNLIVMGTHGYGPVGRLVMGSVATRVLATSKVPVLLTR
jgi:nucleotide-binding universal stress UspA family protein